MTPIEQAEAVARLTKLTGELEDRLTALEAQARVLTSQRTAVSS